MGAHTVQFYEDDTFLIKGLSDYVGAARRRPRNRRRYQRPLPVIRRCPTCVASCEAIIVMAHKLGLLVIAEGVETRQQADLLRHAGCDFGQGFLFGQAMPALAFETMLDN